MEQPKPRRNRSKTSNAAELVLKERRDAEMRRRFNPLEHWTPPVLVRQLNAWSKGELKELAWLMDWVETYDDMISSVAPKAKAAVSRLDWEVSIKKDVRPEQQALADDQKTKLSEFYSNIDARDAIEPYERGGVRLLTHQVMDGFCKSKAVHHLEWRVEPEGLRVKTTFMPLWFFEQKTGELRYLPDQWSYEGEPLENYGDFMISVGRGVMLGCLICKMYKMIPMQDWLTYCDRSGMAAFVGKTSAKKGSEGWNTMVDMVSRVGAEFNAVINTGDDLQALDLSAKGQPPYEKLVDRMDRAIARSFRGADLSTMSRGGASVGASVQQEETLDLDQDNADWVSETIDRNLSPRVLAYYFGDAPKLVEFRLVTRPRDDEKFELQKVQQAQKMGVRVKKQWFVAKFNIEEAEEDDEALVSVGDGGDITLPNDRADVSEVVNAALSKVAAVQATALAPVTDIIDSITQRGAAASDDELRDQARALLDRLPEVFGGQTVEAMATTLREVMEAAAFSSVKS